MTALDVIGLASPLAAAAMLIIIRKEAKKGGSKSESAMLDVQQRT